MSRNITVASDGIARDTVIYDEDGVKFEHCRSVSINIDAASDLVEVTLEITHSRINVKGRVNEITFVCPCCGDVFTHECDDGGSMAAHTDPRLLPQMRQVQPLPAGVGPAIQAPIGGPMHNGLPLLEFNMGQLSRLANHPSNPPTCSFEIKGVPLQGSATIRLKCTKTPNHSEPHHHKDGTDDFYWDFNMSLSPTYRT